MTSTTKIEWCDHTWTPVVGCDAVSPACANCYAALMAARLEAMGQEKYRGVAVRAGGKGKWTGKVNFSEADLVKPLTVRRPGRWFLTSMGDVAHEALTPEQIAEMFGVMAVAGATGPFHREQDGFTPGGTYKMHAAAEEVQIKLPNMLSGPHTFMVLTKRGARMATLLLDSRFRKLVSHAAYRWAHNRVSAGNIADGIYPDWSDWRGEATNYWPMPNVFIGCTVEDQQRADELRPHMQRIAAAGWKTFASYEPALGPVDWAGWEFLKQLISGGESGHKARPSHPDWHRAARDFAQAHGIAYLFKQWGAWAPGNGGPGGDLYERDRTKVESGMFTYAGAWTPGGPNPFRQTMDRIGKKGAGRLLDGREWNEVPA
jgi:protein gp37